MVGVLRAAAMLAVVGAAPAVAQSTSGGDDEVHAYTVEGKTKVEVEVTPRKVEPAPAPPPPAVELSSSGIRTMDPVFFSSGGAEILPRSQPTLDAIAEVMVAHPEIAVLRVEAHTDSMPGNNMKLSERRAQAVVDYLTGRGVEGSRLVARGFGASRPIATNATWEGRSTNRRVEFIIERREVDHPDASVAGEAAPDAKGSPGAASAPAEEP